MSWHLEQIFTVQFYCYLIWFDLIDWFFLYKKFQCVFLHQNRGMNTIDTTDRPYILNSIQISYLFYRKLQTPTYSPWQLSTSLDRAFDVALIIRTIFQFLRGDFRMNFCDHAYTKFFQQHSRINTKTSWLADFICSFASL